MSDQNGEPKPARRRPPAEDTPRDEQGDGDDALPPLPSSPTSRPKPDPGAVAMPPRPEKSADKAPAKPKDSKESKGQTPAIAASKKAPARTAKSAPKEPVTVLDRLVARAARYARWGIGLILFVALGLVMWRVTHPPAPTAIAPLFTPSVQYWAPKIAQWAQTYDVNPNLVATLMQIESCGYPGAASQVGAQGLFQVMPMNFQDSESNTMSEPEINARAGIRVLKDCLRFAEDDVGLAMACYNGGPGLIYRQPVQWPQETKNYYTWGGGIYNDAIRNAKQSATLNQWLSAGGSDLCDRAATTLGLPTMANPPTLLPTAIPTEFTPVPQLPTLAGPTAAPNQIDPGLLPTAQPGSLPTYDMPAFTPSTNR